ncbi:MAG: hypothetical protein GF309_03460 [Candidatus Lokiarchaeota archaeon]|nr:hypothetical protein [Candidatus Lokiarchaeota archaeon]
MAAIGLSFVEQSIMKYADDTGIYLEPEKHAVLRTVKVHAIKENIDSYEFIEVSKEVRFDVDRTKQKLHIVNPYELDQRESKLMVPCLRVGKHTTWPKKYSSDDLMKYREIQGIKKKQQERAEFILSFYQENTRR